MWEILKDLFLVSMGMGIGVVLMCILNVGKEADRLMEEMCIRDSAAEAVKRQIFAYSGLSAYNL